ncbi:MAG: sucrase ferredoxin [Angustibacter sp.]
MCSATSESLQESAFGSAATALAWIGLEQSGPWGRVAAVESHLDAELGRSLDSGAQAAGARFVLVRTPGRHADDHDGRHERHTVLLACADVARPWLLRGELADPHQLEALDVAALVRGDQAAVRSSLPDVELVQDDEPALLVCTNGRRDLCCAVRGRPVAIEAGARRPGQVWETTHTGGHRYSPTGVLLPSGQTLGRFDADLAVAALDAAAHGNLAPQLHGPDHDRGLSALDAPVRAAVSAVREAIGEPHLAALAGSAEQVSDDTWGVRVTHTDGRAWAVEAARRVLGPDRPESCVKPAVPQVGWSVRIG